MRQAAALKIDISGMNKHETDLAIGKALRDRAKERAEFVTKLGFKPGRQISRAGQTYTIIQILEDEVDGIVKVRLEGAKNSSEVLVNQQGKILWTLAG
jgi:hypothetical protein